MFKNLFHNYPPQHSILKDFIVAALILIGIPAAVIWGFYLTTGQYIDLGTVAP